MANHNLCLICRVEIPDEDYVYVERHHDADGEEGWSGGFCGNEHAAQWVAAPFVEPTPPMTTRERWEDRGFVVAVLSILGFVLVSSVVGTVTLGRWVFGTIF
jgi:hypothetical protein